MPSLEQLYNKSPMEQYGDLSWGLRMGMRPEEFGQYQTRQQEYDRRIDELNRRATELNPHIVEQQRLANQQQQYLMPTHQAMGEAAKAKMATPNYFQGQAGSELAGFGKAGAEANLAAATARGSTPTAEGIASAQGQTNKIAADLQRIVIGLTNSEANPEYLPQFLSSLDPPQAQQIKKLIDTTGLAGARDKFVKGITQMSLIDPKHIQARDLEANKAVTPKAPNEWSVLLDAANGDPAATKAWNMHVAQNPSASKAAVIQLAEGYARAAGRKTPNTEDYDKANRVVQVMESVVKVEKLVKDPKTGQVNLVTETTKGQGTQGGGAQPQPGEGKQLTIDGVVYEVIGANPDGSIRIRDPKTGRTGTYK